MIPKRFKLRWRIFKLRYAFSKLQRWAAYPMDIHFSYKWNNDRVWDVYLYTGVGHILHADNALVERLHHIIKEVMLQRDPDDDILNDDDPDRVNTGHGFFLWQSGIIRVYLCQHLSSTL